MLNRIITPELRDLRAAFQRHGYDIRLVGGCVRDLLAGLTPKDIDLCTDADPDQQKAVYEAEGLNHYDTGLSHGTWTVTLNRQPFEITSLRVERDHDGRWATVSYTTDWIADLGRRDLTINAMALTFDGQILDPFDGRADLRSNVVRFVGRPEDRIQEDYLRILRWFRFVGRYGLGRSRDERTVTAICQNAPGLSRISRERVWSEFKRIISGPYGDKLVDMMWRWDVTGPCGLMVIVDKERLQALRVARAGTLDAISLMAALLGSVADVERQAADWKWSKAEKDQAVVVARHSGSLTLPMAKRLVAVDGLKTEYVAEALLTQGDTLMAKALMAWTLPVFPVTGHDLLANGFVTGRAMGERLASLKEEWADSDYTMTRASMIERLTA